MLGGLGGSWVVINGVISKVTTLITLIRGFITALIITTHEPPSRFMVLGLRFPGLGSRKMARIAQGSL